MYAHHAETLAVENLDDFPRIARSCARLAFERIVVFSLPREIDTYQQQTY